MNMKKLKYICWRTYLVAIHLIVLFALLSIPIIRKKVQEERQQPGSQIRSEYDEYPDGGWVRVFSMADRDPVMGVVEDNGLVQHLFVSPPDSPYVWFWDRTKDQSWALQIVEYDSVENAAHHFTSGSSHRLIDGMPYGALDGFPDRELISSDGMKQFFSIEPIERTLEKVVPDN